MLIVYARQSSRNYGSMIAADSFEPAGFNATRHERQSSCFLMLQRGCGGLAMAISVHDRFLPRWPRGRRCGLGCDRSHLVPKRRTMIGFIPLDGRAFGLIIRLLTLPSAAVLQSLHSEKKSNCPCPVSYHVWRRLLLRGVTRLCQNENT